LYFNNVAWLDGRLNKSCAGHAVMPVRPMIGDFLAVMLQVFVFVVLSRRKNRAGPMRS
jgi:F0F1-type ATP synthase membrane subunit a